MVKVAVAGGTGGLGLHAVEAIVEAGNHEVVVLSRKSTHPVLEELGVPVIAVSYDDPVALTKALEGVHTVISTIAGTTEDTFQTAARAPRRRRHGRREALHAKRVLRAVQTRPPR